MMNGRKIGRSSHTLELEELGGFNEHILNIIKNDVTLVKMLKQL